MNALASLELKILDLHGGLTLRPTLERAASIGQLLQEAKDGMPHGEFVTWCKRLPFSMRTTQVYLQVGKAQSLRICPENVTIDQFLRMMRNRVPCEVGDVDDVAAVDDCRVVTADCRSFRWPKALDVICTDPPWADEDAYSWLGEFAADRLRPGPVKGAAARGHPDARDHGDHVRRPGLDFPGDPRRRAGLRGPGSRLGLPG